MGFGTGHEYIRLPGGIEVRVLAVDPTAGAGVAEVVGTIGLRDTGELWQKTDTGDTEWTLIATVEEAGADTSVARFDANGRLKGNPSTFIFDDGKLVCSYGGTSDAITMYLKTATTNHGIRVTEDNVARSKPMIFLTAQPLRTSDIFKIYNYATAENVDSIAITQWGGGHCVHVWLGTALTNSAFRATEDDAARTAPMIDLVAGANRVGAMMDLDPGAGLADVLAVLGVPVITGAGALGAGPLGTKHAWTAAQSPGAPTVLAIAAGHVAWDADTAKQHLQLTLTGAAEVDAPSGTLSVGTPYMLAIIGDGATNPTWNSIFDWGGAAPNFSAVTAGNIAWVSMIAWSATRIHCAAQLGVDGNGFAPTPP